MKKVFKSDCMSVSFWLEETKSEELQSAVMYVCKDNLEADSHRAQLV